jgi:putative nucleotidyltransferase with HDIG domain
MLPVGGFNSSAIEHSHFRLGEGNAGRAALERCIVNISNLSGSGDTKARTQIIADEKIISYFAVPLIAKGVLEIFHHTKLEPDPEWLDFLEALAGQAAITIDNVNLFDNLQRSNIELALAYDATIESWSYALDLRDKETERHSRRVTEMTLRLCRNMGVSDADLIYVRRGALLHDIGKMGIPDRILLKPGPLTEDEWEIMRKHPVYAYQMLSPIAYLRPTMDIPYSHRVVPFVRGIYGACLAVDIPYCHHEKWDGTGYPRGLKGEQIPLAARIFAVVDVWDALRSGSSLPS